MNKFRYRISTLFVSLTVAASLCAQTSFPVVTIHGKKYYFYEVKKGDSLYGIAKAHGWDPEVVAELNPVASMDLKRGTRLYYPVEGDSRQGEAEKTATKQQDTITHTVAKGENIYALARTYDVSPDLIYYQNPWARTDIKPGDTLTIRPDEKIGEIVSYVIKAGDTPYSVARQFNSAVEDIYRVNPGVNDNNFKTGASIKVPTDTNKGRIRREKVMANRLGSFGTYKVKNGESWEGIAKRFGVSATLLQSMNPDVKLKKGVEISVPNYEQVEVTREYVAEDPREKTEDGRMEIFEDVKATAGQTPGKVRVAIVLSDPAQKKDLEFSRGFITAVDKYKNAGFEIDLNIIKGDRPERDVVSELDEFGPGILISTADKDFPVYLTEYAADHNAVLLNPFDVKSDAYAANSQVVQLMPPSAEFNDAVARYITDTFADRKIVVVGTSEDDEALSNMFGGKVDSSHILNLTLDELRDYPFYETERYVVYALQTKKGNVSSLLDIVASAKQESPLTEICVVGRPSWITLVDALKGKMHAADVYIPSRFYFDMDNADSKEFIADYKRIFRHPPLKSFPVYSAMGYDVANYFLPLQATAPGRYDATHSPEHPQLQLDIALRRAGTDGGWLNPVCYMIHYAPMQYVDKIKID